VSARKNNKVHEVKRIDECKALACRQPQSKKTPCREGRGGEENQRRPSVTKRILSNERKVNKGRGASGKKKRTGSGRVTEQEVFADPMHTKKGSRWEKVRKKA